MAFAKCRNTCLLVPLFYTWTIAVRSRRQCKQSPAAQTRGLPAGPPDPGPGAAQSLRTGVSGQKRRPRRQAPSPGPGSTSEVPCPPGKWQFKALTKWGQLLPKKTIRLCSPQVGPTCAQALNARLFPVLFIRGTVPLLFFSHLHAPRTAAWPATGRPLSSFMNHTRACATHVNPTASSKKDRNHLEGPTPNANHCVRHGAGTGPCPQDH